MVLRKESADKRRVQTSRKIRESFFSEVELQNSTQVEYCTTFFLLKTQESGKGEGEAQICNIE